MNKLSRKDLVVGNKIYLELEKRHLIIVDVNPMSGDDWDFKFRNEKGNTYEWFLGEFNDCYGSNIISVEPMSTLERELW